MVLRLPDNNSTYVLWNRHLRYSYQEATENQSSLHNAWCSWAVYNSGKRESSLGVRCWRSNYCFCIYWWAFAIEIGILPFDWQVKQTTCRTSNEIWPSTVTHQSLHFQVGLRMYQFWQHTHSSCQFGCHQEGKSIERSHGAGIRKAGAARWHILFTCDDWWQGFCWL